MAVHDFSSNADVYIKRSTFDRSFTLKTTFDSGYLIPIFLDDVLPGDTINLKCNYLSRLATPIVPIMDNIYFDTFFFSVPLRLVWDNFKRQMGEQKNPGDSTEFLTPVIECPDGGFPFGGVADYFGLPCGVPNLQKISALYFRAYNLIWNEWFRDENLQDSVEVPTGDSSDSYSIYRLLKRGKRKDYFTSALPFPQKGEDVTIGLGSTADIVTDGTPFSLKAYSGSVYTGDVYINNDGAAPVTSGELRVEIPSSSTNNSRVYYNGGLMADLSSAKPISINDLREAVLMQRFLEAQARGGTRYIEQIRQMFGVRSSDARLQRPEYLGGSSGLINISQIPQTSSSDSITPQGNMAATGHYLATNQNGINKSFEEHCIVIGLACIRADLSYQQGIDRMFTRQTIYDYFWPTFAHLGEQEVYNREIYAQGTEDDDKVFGYQERYAEYRYKQNMVTGKMRSTYPQSLDVWHLSQKFDSLPTLSAQFIEENPPIDRVVAVPSEPQFTTLIGFDFNHVRPIPVRSIPGLVDHF